MKRAIRTNLGPPASRTCFIVLALAISLQGGLGVVACVHQVYKARRAAQQKPNTQLFDGWARFIDVHTDADATILYVTPEAGPNQTWDFFRLSQRLYPRTIWHLTPPTDPEAEWWQSALRSRQAQYIVFDGTGLPHPFASAPHWEYSATKLVVQP